MLGKSEYEFITKRGGCQYDSLWFVLWFMTLVIVTLLCGSWFCGSGHLVLFILTVCYILPLPCVHSSVLLEYVLGMAVALEKKALGVH